MADLNIYTIPESFRSTWEAGLISAVTQASAGLNACARQFSEKAKFHEMQSRGSAVIHQRIQRHQKIVADELDFGQRRIYPVGYYAAKRFSTDDLTLKGDLPLSMNLMREAIMEAAAPLPDQVFLGVKPSEEYDFNCVINPQSDKSFYYGTTDDEEPVTHAGTAQGLMGVNFTGQDGVNPEVLPQQPMLGSALATSYADYTDSLIGLNFRKTNVIPVNYTASGTPADSGLTIEKLRAVLLAFRMRHIDPLRTQIWMAITPQQMDNLLGIEEFKNSLYTNKQATETGVVMSAFGINFKVTVDVPIVNIGTEGAKKFVRACPVWTKDTAAFGVWANPKTRINELPDYVDTVQCLVTFAYGAGRRKLEEVITVHCAEYELQKFNS